MLSESQHSCQIEKELKEELEKMKLDSGLSDSDQDDDGHSRTLSENFEKKSSWIGPPVPKHRDAMGAYRTPFGGRPLSILDQYPLPAPNLYMPDVNKITRTYPIWSLGEMFDTRLKVHVPGPNAYDASLKKSKKGPLINARKFPPEKSEGIGWHSKGPASVRVSRNICTGPKYTMRKKPKNSTQPGLVSSLVNELDPRVPGPDYAIPPEEWLQKPQSFGIKPPDPKKESTPGPHYMYKAPDKPRWPAWSLGIAGKHRHPEVTPGPDQYELPSRIGEGPKQSLGLKIYPNKYDFITPGPDQYNRAGFDLSEPGYTMKYRWFERDIVDTKPDPCAYEPKVDLTKKRVPAYTIKPPRKGFTPYQVPSPAHYTIPDTSRRIGGSIGKAKVFSKPRGHLDPGPADYQRICISEHTLPKAPAFSMGLRVDRKSHTGVPGPNHYRIPEPKKMGKSFGILPKGREKSYGPGPASVGQDLDCKCGLPGATLKSRHTPHKFVGLHSNAPFGQASTTVKSVLYGFS